MFVTIAGIVNMFTLCDGIFGINFIILRPLSFQFKLKYYVYYAIFQRLSVRKLKNFGN